MTIPYEPGLDHTLDLLKEGYTYIPNRRRRFHSDIFQTRLLGQKVVCIGGKEAAKVFYDNEKFRRKGAAPRRIQQSLFGKNGVQTMDGEKHTHRKALFMDLMTPEHIKELKEIIAKQWNIGLNDWVDRDQIRLFDEARKIMCRAACNWAGVPLWAKELDLRTADLSAMIDAFGAVGLRHWKGRVARNRTEGWIRKIIWQVRGGRLHPNEHTALYKMAWHRNLDGSLMSTQMAAVELINILRPIVAIARYVTFGALAMHRFPEQTAKLQKNDDSYNQYFVQEVRRYYPFGPFLGARVRNNFEWNGHAFTKGTLVLLDIYGTNHDQELWNNPYSFSPERFAEWDGNLFDFIPQGGGNYNFGHRCAGEWITVEVMKVSLHFLASHMSYKIPEQNLNFNLVRMPPIPKSRVVLTNVQEK
ncbi:cytochrome P450 [Virgibacillus siamensis]|uniref:cytochrome P450 n=1 Tax=Virgibacillus siamensis TaxID=480071 RepID=UPI0009879701|nr:cytochrome P450 [Virgibacillus siamensis]